MPPRLFHVSEESDIEIFNPRPVPSPDAGVTGNAVWAVDELHLPNYLLPRDCPRVTYAASQKTSKEDREEFLGNGRARVVAVETGWLQKIKECHLYLYELPTNTFEMIDAGAGYYISRVSVIPLSKTKIVDLESELAARNVELKALPNLWPLRNLVAASSLEFSIIRFRNALPSEDRLI